MGGLEAAADNAYAIIESTAGGGLMDVSRNDGAVGAQLAAPGDFELLAQHDHMLEQIVPQLGRCKAEAIRVSHRNRD